MPKWCATIEVVLPTDKSDEAIVAIHDWLAGASEQHNWQAVLVVPAEAEPFVRACGTVHLGPCSGEGV